MAPQHRFRDRKDAGRRLAAQLLAYEDASPLVLGLPRGGVPVAFEIAYALDAPLDVWVARKIGAPDQPELGIAAVAEGDEVYIDPPLVASVGVTRGQLLLLVERAKDEVADLARRYRRDRPPPDVRGRTVIVVDDGIATGGTVRATLRAIGRQTPERLVLAAPVGAADTIESLRSEADDVVCLAPVDDLRAVGLWYQDFSPVSDEEVIALLDRAGARPGESTPERSVVVDTGEVSLDGDLAIPNGAQAIVLFAHGSGSSRKSPRNRFVAKMLHRRGLATLLFDLLTHDEEEIDAYDAHLRFDIGLLARRLIAATDWIGRRLETRSLRVGYFGASTGAAAALVAGAERPAVVGAVVSRGGRPDLAGRHLGRVRAPTLLIVGGEDRDVLRLHRAAMQTLAAPAELKIVPGATHLFEEPGALETVARMAGDWFVRHLTSARAEARP